MKKKFTIIGLGHFGFNLGLSLTNLGAEVLVIDNNESHVEGLRDRVAHAVIADARDKSALMGLGLEDMDAGIVAIGENFESSLLATANLQEIGVKRIISRVVSPTHEKLLRLMNVDELILPEANAAVQLSNKLIHSGVVQYLGLSKQYGIVEIKVPSIFVGQSLSQVNLRKSFNVNLITVMRHGAERGLLPFFSTGTKEEVLGIPEGSYVFDKNDVLVLFGAEGDLRQFLS